MSLLVWLAFGAVAITPALKGLTWQLVVYAVLSLTTIRMAPVALPLASAGLGRRAAAFIGWFGPRGLASVVFAPLALEDLGEQVARPAVTVIAVTILSSVIAHGASAEPLEGRMDRRLLHYRMRRRAVVPYATATSGQPLPYLPLPMARTGVPAEEGRTALPIFQTGTRRQGVLCGSAPTLYSSQVQQQARIPAHYREPLRTTERLPTWASAGCA